VRGDRSEGENQFSRRRSPQLLIDRGGGSHVCCCCYCIVFFLSLLVAERVGLLNRAAVHERLRSVQLRYACRHLPLKFVLFPTKPFWFSRSVRSLFLTPRSIARSPWSFKFKK
jgi:hypothetical protein